MPANIDHYASLKRWAAALLACGIFLLFLAISRDAARSVTPRIVAAKPTAPAVPTIADATAAINQALREIYSALTRGEPTLAAGYLVPHILQNTEVLDFICRPFNYRAHYIEAVAERPDPTGLIFQARVRLLLKPLEEQANPRWTFG